jgi:hypothetical protein
LPGETGGQGSARHADLLQVLAARFGTVLPAMRARTLVDRYHLSSIDWYWYILCFLALSPFFLVWPGSQSSEV